jgi:hypothetical protein
LPGQHRPARHGTDRPVSHELQSTDAMLYTYETQTLKPFCMTDPTVSSMELIDAAQSVPHVGGDPVQAQALCVGHSMKRVTGHNWKQDRTDNGFTFEWS